MTIYTKNFHPETDPKLLCTCGNIGCDRRSVNQDTLDALQLVRNDLDAPVRITSGGRCPLHPAQVCKSDPNSGDNAIRKDDNGNTFVSINGNDYILNKPGLSKQDLGAAIGNILSFLPVSKVALRGA